VTWRLAEPEKSALSMVAGLFQSADKEKKEVSAEELTLNLPDGECKVTLTRGKGLDRLRELLPQVFLDRAREWVGPHSIVKHPEREELAE
jgi:hypothetical protein